MVFSPDPAFGFAAGSALATAAIVEEAMDMDTSAGSQPMTVCGPGAQPHSSGIPQNFHLNRWRENETDTAFGERRKNTD